MNQPAGRYRRTQLFVNSTLQTRMILWIAWPPTVCLLIGFLGLLGFARYLYGQAAALDIALPGTVSMALVGLFFLFVSVAFISYQALRISHRVAGPAYRIGRVLDRVREGQSDQRVRLRDGDMLRGLEGEVNDFLDWCAAQKNDPERPASAPSSEAECAPETTSVSGDGD